MPVLSSSERLMFYAIIGLGVLGALLVGLTVVRRMLAPGEDRARRR